MTVLNYKPGLGSGLLRKRVRFVEDYPGYSVNESRKGKKTDFFLRSILKRNGFKPHIKQRHIAVSHENDTQIQLLQKQLAQLETMNDYLTSSKTDEKSSTDESPRNAAASLHWVSPIATLTNLGNTCFVNSILYTLRFTPHFLHHLHHLASDLSDLNERMQTEQDSKKTREDSSAVSNPRANEAKSSQLKVATEKLHELYKSLHASEHEDENSSFKPYVFLHALREANSIFKDNQQHDAHEFLVCLRNIVRETYPLLSVQVSQSHPSSESNDSSITADIDEVTQSTSWMSEIDITPSTSWMSEIDITPSTSWMSVTDVTPSTSSMSVWKSEKKVKVRMSEREIPFMETEESETRRETTDFIAELFEGVAVQQTTCLECDHVSERRESFCDISIPVTTDQGVENGKMPVDDNEFYQSIILASEILRDQNKYSCQSCGRHTDAHRSISYESLPPILTLHLKRFSSALGSMGCMTKITDYMPTPMTLSCFCEKCTNNADGAEHHYELYGVVMHIGATMSAGHYVAYLKALKDFADYSQSDIDKEVLSCSKGNEKCDNVDCCRVRINNSVMGMYWPNCDDQYRESIVTSGNRSLKERPCNGRTSKNPASSVILDTSAHEHMWFECNDENVRILSQREFEGMLAPKPADNTDGTPYLLFYAKCP